jgi:hypothetical protein
MQYHFVPTKMTVIKKMEDLSELLYQNSIDRVICTHDVLFLTAVDTRKFENKDPADSVSSGVLCSYVVPSHLGLTMWKGKGSSLQTLLQRHWSHPWSCAFMTSLRPKTPLPNAFILVISYQHMKFRGHKQSYSMDKLESLYIKLL